MIKSLYRFLNPRFQNVFLDYKVDFKPRFGHTSKKGPHPQLLEIIQAGREGYADHLNGFLKYADIFNSIKERKEETDENEPGWNNDFLPGLDIVALYGMLSRYNPARYIEVGSGNSTQIVRKAIKEQGLQTKITSIDPYPRASIDHLADTVIRKPVENMDNYSIFSELERGDILFIDNSHRSLPNSDVTVCFLEIFPILKPGVIVQIHDIYIPFDYPQDMCDRAYSEQYVLSPFILANPKKYRPILPNYFVSEDKELSKILEPLWSNPKLKNVECHGGSFWIEIGE